MNFPAIIATILGRRPKRIAADAPLPLPKPKPKPDPNSFVWVYRYECADCGEHVAGINACAGIPTERLRDAVIPAKFDGPNRTFNKDVLHLLTHFRAVLRDNGYLQDTGRPHSATSEPVMNDDDPLFDIEYYGSPLASGIECAEWLAIFALAVALLI